MESPIEIKIPEPEVVEKGEVYFPPSITSTLTCVSRLLCMRTNRSMQVFNNPLQPSVISGFTPETTYQVEVAVENFDGIYWLILSTQHHQHTQQQCLVLWV